MTLAAVTYDPWSYMGGRDGNFFSKMTMSLDNSVRHLFLRSRIISYLSCIDAECCPAEFSNQFATTNPFGLNVFSQCSEIGSD